MKGWIEDLDTRQRLKIVTSIPKGTHQMKSKKHYEKGLDYPVAQVRKWHRMFDLPVAESPRPLEKEEAFQRMSWTNEEIVEFLYATVGGNKEEFVEMVSRLQNYIEQTKNKIIEKSPIVDDILTAQVDAGTDIEVFQKGTWVQMGVYPQEFFNIVMKANTGKVWDDGTIKRREGDGKVIKPPHWEDKFAPEPRLKKAIRGQVARAEKRNVK